MKLNREKFTEEEFLDLVFYYGAGGCEAFKEWDFEFSENQEQIVAIAWSRCEHQNEIDEANGINDGDYSPACYEAILAWYEDFVGDC